MPGEVGGGVAVPNQQVETTIWEELMFCFVRNRISCKGLVLVLLLALVVATGCQPAAAPTAVTAPEPTQAVAEPTTAIANPTAETVATAIPAPTEAATAVPPTEVPATEVPATEPQAGGDLIFAINVEPPSLDPHTSSAFATRRVAELVYNGLVRYDKNMEIIPDLATSWTISDDNLTYTFKLRDDVKFHNGRQMTAQDVVYSFTRIMTDPKSSRKGLLSAVDKVAAADDYTVNLTLKQPFTPLLANLAAGIYIVPQEVVEEKGDLANTAVGTGPFKFIEWVPKSHIKLEKNPDYFETGKPYLDSVTIQIVPEESARIAAVRTGQVQIAVLREANSSDLLADEKSLNIQKTLDLNFHVLGLNNNKEPLSDVRVRQALSLAINRQELMETCAFGKGAVAGPIPPGLSAWTVPTADLANYQQDVVKAKALLAEAGQESGFELSVMTSPTYPEMVCDAQVIQAQLKEIDVDVKIDQTEWGTYVERWGKHDMVAYTGINGQTSFDPDYGIYPALYTKGSWNVYEFSDADVDKLLDEGRSTIDDAARKQIYGDLQKLVAEKAPLLYLYSASLTDAVSTKVHDYVLYPSEERSSLKDAWLGD